MNVKWECPGCDEQQAVPFADPVIVKSPGRVALVMTCPGCGCTHVDESLEAVRLALLCVTTATLVDRDLAVGARRRGPINEAEVYCFRKRLESTPDGRSEAPWHARQYVLLASLWAELAEVQR